MSIENNNVTTLKIEEVMPQLINILAAMSADMPLHKNCLYTASDKQLINEFMDSLAALHKRKVDIGKLLMEKIKNEYTTVVRRNASEEGKDNVKEG